MNIFVRGIRFRAAMRFSVPSEIDDYDTKSGMGNDCGLIRSTFLGKSATICEHNRSFAAAVYVGVNDASVFGRERNEFGIGTAAPDKRYHACKSHPWMQVF